MRYEDFLKQLNKLKGIAPSKEYSEKSLRLIFASRQAAVPETSWQALLMRIGAVGAFAAIALVVVSKSSVPMKIAGLDVKSLRAEAEVLAVNLELAEIKQSSEQNKRINVALKETAKSDPGHLNTLVLEREADAFDFDAYYNQDINAALEAVAD